MMNALIRWCLKDALLVVIALKGWERKIVVWYPGGHNLFHTSDVPWSKPARKWPQTEEHKR